MNRESTGSRAGQNRLHWHERRYDLVLFKRTWTRAIQLVIIYLHLPFSDTASRLGSERVFQGPLRVTGTIDGHSFRLRALPGAQCLDCGGEIDARRKPPFWRWVMGTAVALMGLVAVAYALIDPWSKAEQRWQEAGVERMVALGLDRTKIAQMRAAGRLSKEVLGLEGPKLYETNDDLYRDVGAETPEQRTLVDLHLSLYASKEGRANEAELSKREKWRRDTAAQAPFRSSDDYERAGWYAALGLFCAAFGWRLRRVRAGLECSGCHRVLAF